MSIASEIQRISSNIADSYIAVNNKGGVLPVDQNSNNLAEAIDSIQTGITPIGTISINSNGSYDVTDYAIANVSVATGGGAFIIDENGKISSTVYDSPIDFTSFSDIGDYTFSHYYDERNDIFDGGYGQTLDLSGLEQISGDHACTYMYANLYENGGAGDVDMSNITEISGSYACYNMFYQTQFASLDMSSLHTISGDHALSAMFKLSSFWRDVEPVEPDPEMLDDPDFDWIAWDEEHNSSPKSKDYIKFDNLTTISGDSALSNMFEQCSGINSISFPSLRTISGNWAFGQIFLWCYDLQSIEFPVLDDISGAGIFFQAFYSTDNLTDIYFPALKTISFGNNRDQFYMMLAICSNKTLHFPSNLSSKIPTLQGYPNFSGSNTVILYDLPATE